MNNEEHLELFEGTSIRPGNEETLRMHAELYDRIQRKQIAVAFHEFVKQAFDEDGMSYCCPECLLSHFNALGFDVVMK